MPWLEPQPGWMGQGDNSQPQQPQQSQKAALPADSTPMLNPQTGDVHYVPNSQVQAVTAGGGKPVVRMVNQSGENQWIPTDLVPQARQNNYAISPNNAGVMKAVDYNSGQVNYVLPSEAKNFQNAGHAIVQPDGSISYPIIRDKNGVIFQDPLEEQKAHQRVYDALNAEEKSRTNSYELKEFGKAGLKATAATALGVTGASGAGALTEPTFSTVTTAGGAGFGGAAPVTAEVAGPSLLSQGAQWLNSLPTWVKIAAAGGGGAPFLKKWFSGH